MSIYAGQSPKELYRSFFRHLRHLPDPHVWSVLQPRFRALLHRSHDNDLPIGNEPESSNQASLRSLRARRNADDELRKLQMAVSYYPHALRRLLGACYGRTGRVRWQLIRNVLATSNPPVAMQGRPALPGVLAPLAPLEPKMGTRPLPRARTTIPDSATRKKVKRIWTREWRGVQVPLVITATGGPKTGWEGKGIVESLRILASLDPRPSITQGHRLPVLPDFTSLSPTLQRIYPLKLRPSPITQYSSPPPRATRENPKKWSSPHRLTARSLRRAYSRLWSGLPWVMPLDTDMQMWKACTYETASEPHLALPRNDQNRKSQSESARRNVWPSGYGANRAWL